MLILLLWHTKQHTPKSNEYSVEYCPKIPTWDTILKTKDASAYSFFEHTCTSLSLGMYFASFILSPKGPDETCTQGSSGQQQFIPGLPAVLSPGTLPLPTVTRFDKFTLTFTWTHVLKFFLYKSRTWRSPDPQKSWTTLGRGQPPGWKWSGNPRALLQFSNDEKPPFTWNGAALFTDSSAGFQAFGSSEE